MTVSVSSSNLILKKVRSTGKEIGRGAYGRVFEVKYEKKVYAAKVVHAILLQYAQTIVKSVIDLNPPSSTSVTSGAYFNTHASSSSQVRHAKIRPP